MKAINYRQAMEALPIVRGEFVAVQVDRKWIASGAYLDKAKPGSKEYRKAVLARLAQAGKEKRFACPGNCGNCLPDGLPACADPRLDGVAIGIGLHG